MATVDEMLLTILKNEGGFTNHPDDHGGATNWGVTIGEYGVFLGRKATVADVREMPIEHAKTIFAKKYYVGPGIDKLPAGIQPVVFDASVLYGPKRAIIFLQKILNVGADGSIGPATIAAADNAVKLIGIDSLINAYCDSRIEFCQAIVRNNPSQRVFIKGWTNRANSFRPKVKK